MLPDIIAKFRKPAMKHATPPLQPAKSGDRKGKSLAAVAEETLDVLPGLLRELPHIDAAASIKYDLEALPPLDKAQCPHFEVDTDEGAEKTPGSRISVINSDTFDAALLIMSSPGGAGPTAVIPPLQPGDRVAVLNLASDKNPGGGWLHGAAAQEEALCFRSSLTLSLHQHYYPWTPRMSLYTRDVVVIRAAIDAGHELLRVPPAEMPVVSVISVAGLRSPPLCSNDRQAFALREDRELTKDKMRLTLRVAAAEGHRHLVLGAIGCGAFANPPRDVARCWLEVLREAEFAGGWWQTLWFAVYDSRYEGNFAIFKDVLDGKIV
ncbi:TIGR02452 family protein [Microdochium nivale]|nr:TIGR02452 family protein [Microdochium nivale]